MFKETLSILLIISTVGQSQVCRLSQQECGGIAQHKCCSGQQLTCIYEKPIHPEARGICQKTCSKEGQICGGFMSDPQVCCDGLECGPTRDLAMDKPGTCHIKAF